MSLFEQAERETRRGLEPLAARMRPRSLSEFVGQRHFLGEGKLLTRLVRADRLGSVILHGPPGTGKTTLAQLLATETKAKYRPISAVASGVKDLREVLAEAVDLASTQGRRTLLFVDEIHRFNKSQQDVLLPDVENGTIVLVGATTENPYFAINQALLSRSRCFQFEPLSREDIQHLLSRALSDRERGFGKQSISLAEDAAEFLAETCDGDARRALSTLEIGVLSTTERPLHFTRELAAESLQKKSIEYDSAGDSHYDCTSALIKSIRGSDPDAAIYWLARMLEAGEEVRFLCRRLLILASEDVGNADPAALPLAVAAMQACEFVGLPECQLHLAHVTTYLACAPKSNASMTALGEALEEVRNKRLLPVPRHLRDSHYQGAKALGHGQGYTYSQDSPGGIAAQDYLGVERIFYRPSVRGFERELAERLEKFREILRQGKEAAGPTSPPDRDALRGSR